MISAFKRAAGISALALCAVFAVDLLSASPAAAEDNVRIGAAAINVVHSAVALGAAKPDIIGRHGISLQVNDLRGASPNCIAALPSGAADLCQVGTPTGTDLVAVAVLTGPVAEIVLSKKAVDTLQVKPDAPVDERVKAMKGLNIGTSAPGSANYTILDSLRVRSAYPSRISDTGRSPRCRR